MSFFENFGFHKDRDQERPEDASLDSVRRRPEGGFAHQAEAQPQHGGEVDWYRDMSKDERQHLRWGTSYTPGKVQTGFKHGM